MGVSESRSRGEAQSTIARSVAWEGIGLHSGVPGRVSLSPAAPDSGLVFVRVGAKAGDRIEFPARVANLRSGARATTLGPAAAPLAAIPLDGELAGAAHGIATVEHLLASLYAFELDNVRIEVEGPELPALDGSALPIVDRLLEAGRVAQTAQRHPITLTEPIEIVDGDRWIRATPADELLISYAVDFDHPLVGRQSLDRLALDPKRFECELAGARTFGFVHEVEALRAAGLALGGSLDNTLVLDDRTVVNGGGLRFPDEFVRHKVIDLLGDLALLGAPLHAHVEVERGGHTLHHRLAEALAREAQPAGQPA